MKPFIVSIVFLTALPCAAETCKYIDKEGRVTYSNVPVRDAKKVSCFEPPAPARGTAKPSDGDRGDDDAARKRVDTDTQRSRDQQRREILESELAAEQQRLEEAKKALAEQESIRTGDERNYARVLERLKPYQEAVATHKTNVESIKRELENLR